MKTGFGLKILKNFHFSSDGSRWERGFYARLKKNFLITFFAVKQAVLQVKFSDRLVFCHSAQRLSRISGRFSDGWGCCKNSPQPIASEKAILRTFEASIFLSWKIPSLSAVFGSFLAPSCKRFAKKFPPSGGSRWEFDFVHPFLKFFFYWPMEMKLNFGRSFSKFPSTSLLGTKSQFCPKVFWRSSKIPIRQLMRTPLWSTTPKTPLIWQRIFSKGFLSIRIKFSSHFLCR